MAFDSWGKIYNHIKRQLMTERNRITYFVVESLATCCDGYGVCWPHPETISDQVGYQVESVYAALQDLLDRDWLRVHIEQNTIRRRIQYTWQLSPSVFYIVDERIAEAWTSYNLALKDYNVSYIFMKESEPVPESRTRTRPGPKSRPKILSLNPNSNQKPPPPPPPAIAGPTAPASRTAPASQNQRTAQNQPAQSAIPNTPPSSAPPPQLSNEADLLAWKIKLCGTSIKQARGLIDQYGLNDVQAAYELVKQKAVNEENVRNPVGMMRAFLKSGMGLSANESYGWNEKEFEQQEGVKIR